MNEQTRSEQLPPAVERRWTTGDYIALTSVAAGLLSFVAFLGMTYQSNKALREEFVEFRTETRAQLDEMKRQQIQPEAARRISVLEVRDSEHDRQIAELREAIATFQKGQERILFELRASRR